MTRIDHSDEYERLKPEPQKLDGTPPEWPAGAEIGIVFQAKDGSRVLLYFDAAKHFVTFCRQMAYEVDQEYTHPTIKGDREFLATYTVPALIHLQPGNAMTDAHWRRTFVGFIPGGAMENNNGKEHKVENDEGA